MKKSLFSLILLLVVLIILVILSSKNTEVTPNVIETPTDVPITSMPCPPEYKCA